RARSSHGQHHLPTSVGGSRMSEQYARSKVTARHLSKDAYLYVRQSSLAHHDDVSASEHRDAHVSPRRRWRLFTPAGEGLVQWMLLAPEPVRTLAEARGCANSTRSGRTGAMVLRKNVAENFP